MQMTAVIFDLDGTLLDTLEDIAVSANSVLRSLDYEGHSVAAFRSFIGSGVDVLFERALPAAAAADRRLIDLAVERFRVVYADGWHINSRPYAGIAALLDKLCERDVALAVLSNKPHEFAVQCVAHLLGDWHFEIVLGHDAALPAKPDPQGALRIAATLGIEPAAIRFVGDSGIDMETARAAGMQGVGVTWGFQPESELRRSGATWLIDRPEQLLELL
jgi:phosphoglycolate phosphatase